MPVSAPKSASNLRERPLHVDDAEALAALIADAARIDGGHRRTVADCARLLSDPGLDRAADSLAVFDGPELVAYQVLGLRRGVCGGGDAVRSDAVVAPGHRRRGIGTGLVARGLATARANRAALHVRVPEFDAGAAAVAARAGLRPVRWFTDMTRDLAATVDPVVVPSAVELIGLGPVFDPDRWDEPLRRAHNAAFADHWGSAAVSAAAWRYHRTGTEAFRPANSVAAVADGQVVGYALSYEVGDEAADRELELGTVGTVRAWRGRGLAGAMTAHVLAGAAAGYATSSLTVDADNPTGALGVYERAGYVPCRRAVVYAG